MASKSYFPSYHSPFSATSSDKVDTSSFSSPPTKTDSCQKKMNRKEVNSQPLSPKATTEEVYQHLGLAWPPVRKLRLSEGSSLATVRLSDVNFEVSPSQPVTPGQGNSCMFHALLDQLRFHQVPSIAASHSQLRAKLVQAAYNSVKAGKLTWPEGETVEEWRMLMGQEGTMGDQVVLLPRQVQAGPLCSCSTSVRAGSSPPIIKVSGQNLERINWWRVCNDLC